MPIEKGKLLKNVSSSPKCDRIIKVDFFVASAMRKKIMCRHFVPGLRLFATANPCIIPSFTFVLDDTEVAHHLAGALKNIIPDMKIKVKYAKPTCDIKIPFGLLINPSASWQLLLFAHADLFTDSKIIALMDDDALLRLPLLEGSFLSEDGRKLRIVQSKRSIMKNPLIITYGFYNGTAMSSFPYFLWREDLPLFRLYHMEMSGFSLLHSYMLTSTGGQGNCMFTGFMNYAIQRATHRYTIQGDEAVRIADHSKYTYRHTSGYHASGLLRNGFLATLACGYGVTALCTSQSTPVHKDCSCVSVSMGENMTLLPSWTTIGKYVFVRMPIEPIPLHEFSLWERRMISMENLVEWNPNWIRDAEGRWRELQNNWTIPPLVSFAAATQLLERDAFERQFMLCQSSFRKQLRPWKASSVRIDTCPKILRMRSRFAIAEFVTHERQIDWYQNNIRPLLQQK
jgi:hypothetical protein